MKTLISWFILLCFTLNGLQGPNQALSQEFRLPAPGVMVPLSPEFNPPILKGIKIHPDNPLRFDFILDQGDSQLSNAQLKNESAKLIKYFLASLTIPENDLWVNLSPYEKDRIIPQSFGLTEMGRDLLVEDYMLKQVTASLIYPENEIGKKFWKRIYEQAAKKYGTTNIAVNTFNKVWIVPQKAVIYENAKAGTAYVVESKLKVMLEEDYLSLEKHVAISPSLVKEGVRGSSKDISAKAALPLDSPYEIASIGANIVREIVIPELTREVNESKNFAQLRQVYNSLILATWYKKKIKGSILAREYDDQNKIAGINIKDPQEKEKIYQRYLQAFKKGVYNYIKEDFDPVTQETIARKYFSGGVSLSTRAMIAATQYTNHVPQKLDHAMQLTVNMAMNSFFKFSMRPRMKFLVSILAILSIVLIINFARHPYQMTNKNGGVIGVVKHIFSNRKISPIKALNIEDIQNRADKNTLIGISNIVDQELVGPKNNILELFIRIHSKMKSSANLCWVSANLIANNDISLTREQDIAWRNYIAQIVRLLYGYWLDSVGITNKTVKENALKYLMDKTDLGYLGQNVEGETTARITFNLEPRDIDIGIDPLIILRRIAPHELAHFFADNNDDNEIFRQLKAASGIHPGDDLTWLLAQASGDIKDLLLGGAGKEGINIERGNSPLATHAALRDIPQDTWSNQVKSVNNKYRVPALLGDPDWSVKQGGDMARYAYQYFGPETRFGPDDASEFFIHLYGTHHEDMSFAQMELAAAIKQKVLQDYELHNISTIDFEKSIIEWVNNMPLRPDVTYGYLANVRDESAKGLARKWGNKVLIKRPNKAQLIHINVGHKLTGMAHKRGLSRNGGIDLTPANMNLQTQNNGGEIKFYTDPAMLAQLQKSTGLVPMITNIQQLNDIQLFLGINKVKN